MTLTPSEMSRAEVDALKKVGFNDAAILELVHIIGFFNHINRIADALGVDLEPWMDSK